MKIALRTLVASLILVPVLAACGGSTGELTGGEWKLTADQIDGVDLATYGVSIDFEDGTVAGQAPVNRYNGTYEISPEGAMEFGPIASTKMAGPQDAMDAETAYFTALDSVTSFTLTGGELDMYAGDVIVLTYQR